MSEDPIGFRAGTSNFYIYAFSNPLIYSDPSGFVGCFYDISSGSLICNSDNGKQKVDFGPGGSFSGNGLGRDNPSMFDIPDRGPIPPGHYTIEPTADPNKFNLRPSPLTRLKNFFNGRRRHFQLHSGERSNGCITIKKTHMAKWGQLQTMFSLDAGNNTLEVRE